VTERPQRPEEHEAAVRDFLAKAAAETGYELDKLPRHENLAKKDDGWAPGYDKGGPNPGYRIQDAPESVWPTHEPPKPRGTGRKRNETRAVKIIRDGEEDWIQLGNDEAAIRAFVDSEAGKAGYSSTEIVEAPRGRPGSATRPRQAALARIVGEARQRGATLEAIGAVIGRSKQRVSALASEKRNL
jgi:hypothetical protein